MNMVQHISTDSNWDQILVHNWWTSMEMHEPSHTSGDLWLNPSVANNPESLSARSIGSIAYMTTHQAKNVVRSFSFLPGDKYVLIEDTLDDLSLPLPWWREVIFKGKMNNELCWVEIIVGGIQRMASVRFDNLWRW